jgi:homoserine kinase type II
MSVYTTLNEADVAAFLKRYSVGSLVELKGIAAGIENTNYFVTTTHGRYVLTLFERLTRADLPFYLDLMTHLARHGIPCPAPIVDRNDEALAELKSKPAALVTRLAGATLTAPHAPHCAQVGAILADMHLAAQSFAGGPENPRGAAWRIATAPMVLPFLDARRRALLEDELTFQARHTLAGLPRGPVHADLFRDNVLFDGEVVGGVIDFYFAGVDTFLFDLAVTVNDWCIEADGRIDAERSQALLEAYHATRPLLPEERAAWPVAMRAAALRFWLSRLYDFYLPRPGELVHAHDPEHFHRILALRVAESDRLPWVH